MAAMKVSDL